MFSLSLGKGSNSFPFSFSSKRHIIHLNLPVQKILKKNVNPLKFYLIDLQIYQILFKMQSY